MATFFRITGIMWADFFAYYALWMMMIYLTDVWKLDFTHAAAIINIWRGSALILPLAFVHLADAFLGNFCILLLTSLSYSIGLGLLWMSTPPVLANSSNNCKEYKPECIGEQQKQLFYAALALIAAGIAGHLTSLGNFIVDQTQNMLNDFQEDANMSTCCCMFAGGFMGVLIPIIGLIIVSLVKSWGVQFGICALFALASLLVFLSGVCSYKYVGPTGSALTTVFRVYFAALSKMFCRSPQDVDELYEERNVNENDALLPHTKGLRCLDKAAIILPEPALEQQKLRRWKLCSVTEVESTKTFIRSIPLWVTLIFCGVVSAIGDTYFLEQAATLNPKLGRIKIPLILLLGFYDQAKNLFSTLFVMIANGITGQSKSRRFVSPVGVAVSMVFSILCCIAAAKIETRRLGIVKSHGLMDKPDERVPMTIFWIIPQFALLGALDGIRDLSVTNLVAGRAPRSMLQYFNFILLSIFGIGCMGSAVSVYVVGRISKKVSGLNWFQSTLNKSRLDKYYWVLAALSAINLVVYIVVACFYSFKDSGEELEVPEFQETEDNIFNHME